MTRADPDLHLGRLADGPLARFGDREAVHFEGRWHRSGELAERSRRVAAGLRALGVQPGDRVVVFMANCPEVGILYTALWRAGAVATPAIFLLGPAELRHVLADSEAVAVVTTSEFVATVLGAAEGLPALRHVVVVGDAGDAADRTLPFSRLEEAAPIERAVDRTPEDMAALLYTGGTTGRSKGVVLSHRNLVSAATAAYASSHREGVNRTLVPLPLSHVYGLTVSVIGMVSEEAGSSVLLRWFDPTLMLGQLAEHRVQATAVVPTMLQMLLAQPLEDHDLSRLVQVTSGGSPLAAEVGDEWERRLPGCTVTEGYGCTETAAIIATQPHDAPRRGTVGRPVPGTEVRLVTADGADASPGEDGEIVVRGPQVMQGYWRSPDATAEAVRDGWFHTGDVGRFDGDGYLMVVDRIKDLIIRGGFNVYPRDVEDVLLTHADVTAAAVVGRPDPTYGEEVVAFVSLCPGSPETAETLQAWARENIAATKYPREVRVVDVVPVTSVFKTDRKALRALVTAPV